MKHAIVTTSLLLVSAAGITAAERETKPGAVYGPSICVDARFWNTPGWQSRDGDYASVRIGTGRNAAADVQRALKAVPPNRRMIRFLSMAGAEQILHQLVEVQGLKLASLAYDLGDSPLTADGAACKAGQTLAHRYGLKFVVSIAQPNAERAGEQLAGCVDAISIRAEGGRQNAVAAVERQRKLYKKLLAANPSLALFEDVPVLSQATDERPGRLLRCYRGNADLVRGIVVRDAGANAQAVGSLLRAIRPPLGQASAFAPDQGPSMYFWNFHWNTPGWQPRKGDYAYVKIRPALKTLDDKVSFVLKELKDIPPQYRKLMFNGLAGAGELLRELIEVRRFPIAAMDYDLEQWELTPGEEKADPIAACKRGQALANKYKMSFAVCPDMPMSAQWGAKVAPYIEGLAPQCKGLQAKNIDEAILRQRKLYSEIWRANPNLILYHDLGASPKGVLQTVEGLTHYYGGVADLVDGIEIWSQDTPQQRDVIGKYIIAVRPPWRPAGR